MDDQTSIQLMTLSMLATIAERQAKIVRTLSRLDEQVRANTNARLLGETV